MIRQYLREITLTLGLSTSILKCKGSIKMTLVIDNLQTRLSWNAIAVSWFEFHIFIFLVEERIMYITQCAKCKALAERSTDVNGASIGQLIFKRNSIQPTNPSTTWSYHRDLVGKPGCCFCCVAVGVLESSLSPLVRVMMFQRLLECRH